MNIVENDHHFIRLRLSCKLLNPTFAFSITDYVRGWDAGVYSLNSNGSVQGYKVLG